MSWTVSLADALQVDEAGLKLVLGQLFAYPIFFFFRFFVAKSSAIIQHLYIILTGMALGYWSLGGDAVLHTNITIICTYLVLYILGPTLLSASIAFAFNMAYLLIGYYVNATEGYDICWTMPQCVLCLRLIAVSIDYYDGTKNEEHKMSLVKLPSLLELFSQCWFAGSYFVGPQFSMVKYLNFIERNSTPAEITSSPVAFGLQRLAMGAIYMTGHIIGSNYVPVDYVLTDEFTNLSFFEQNFWGFLWVKAILSKYIAVWLISEGSFIISGLSYDGKDEDGNDIWTGGANVKLRLFEGASSFGEVIKSFNINTNNWAAYYVYKRLKFLGDRLKSQFITLMFLSLWHGLHSGYYLTFFNEFIIMNFEKDLSSILKKNERIQHWLTHPGSSTFIWIVGKLYVSLFMAHCFVPFALLKKAKYLTVIYNTRGLLYLCFIPWPLFSVIIKTLLKTSKKTRSKED